MDFDDVSAHRTWEDYAPGHNFWKDSLLPNSICLIVETEDYVHVVEDCRDGQIYIFEQLTDFSHYQKMLPHLANHFKSLTPNKTIRFYRNDKNHVNDYCVILNGSTNTGGILGPVDFAEISTMLDASANSPTFGTERQPNGRRISFGYTSGCCSERNSSGSAIPVLCKGTNDTLVHSIFMALTSIFAIPGLPAWAAYIPTEIRRRFAEKICPGNLLEASSCHGTKPELLLIDHKDSHNPKHVPGCALSCVVGFSKWFNGERIGCTGYQRKSICDYLRRTDELGPMLEDFAQVYEQLPHYRRNFTPHNFGRSILHGRSLDDEHFSIPCNMDPLGYHSLFIHSLILLISIMRLTYPQVIGVTACLDIFPNCAYFFSLAVNELISSGVYHGDRLDLGHFLIQRMLHFRDSFCDANNSSPKRQKVGVNRFRSSLKRPEFNNLPTKDDLRTRTHLKTFVCLYTWAKHSKKPNLKSIYDSYNNCSSMLQATVVGMGPLGALHQMAILSAIGIIPPWIREYAPLNGKSLKFLQQKYPPSPRWGNGDTQRRLMSTILSFMESKFLEGWSLAKVENFLCKFKRLKTPTSDSMFFDVHRKEEMILSLEGKHLAVYLPSGRKVTLPTGCVCQSWALSNSTGSLMTNTYDIASVCLRDIRMGSTLPDIEFMQRILPKIAVIVELKFPVIQEVSSVFKF